MDYIKKAINQLKGYKETVTTTELLPNILKQNKLEIYATNKALENMDELDRRVLQRTCIDNINPNDLEKEFGMSYRKIYRIREVALKKFARMVYGIKLFEEDGNSDSKMHQQ